MSVLPAKVRSGLGVVRAAGYGGPEVLAAGPDSMTDTAQTRQQVLCLTSSGVLARWPPRQTAAGASEIVADFRVGLCRLGASGS